MKKRIAVFVNGWGSDYMQETVHGIYEKAKAQNVDVFVFTNFSTFAGIQDNNNKGESNIYHLPDLADFDGVILMANSFNMQDEIDYLSAQIKEVGIPAISIEYEIEGADSITTDNYFGMHELAEHMIQVHGVKRIVYMGGPQGHQESNIRLQAVKDAAKENGITIGEEDILYGDWAKNQSLRLMDDWYEINQTYPDVVICANDIMATGVCEWVVERGYKVPEDVKVTGYDCIRASQEHEPVITTVTHRWNEMGDRAFKLLYDKMQGSAKIQPITVKTGFVCGESCGCKFVNSRFDLQMKLKNTHARKMDAMRADQHFRHIYTAVRKDETAEAFSGSLSYLYSHESWMVGEYFMLCLEPQFFHVEENDENLRMAGYSDEVDVICSLFDGAAREHITLDRKTAMFRTANEREDAGIYIFVPMHSDGKNMGFAMLSSGVDIVEDNYLYIWTRHMNEYLEQVRRNVKLAELTRKLTELSITDVLTGVYNRAGCEKIIYPYLEECQEAGEQGIVMIVDIDRMKTINDKFGHANGDLALRMVSSVLRAELPQGFMVGRFGGDEFLVGGKYTPETSVEFVIDKITKKLAEEAKRREIPFDLSVSMGGVTMEKGEIFELEKCLAKADEYMYAVKEKHHAEIDGVKQA